MKIICAKKGNTISSHQLLFPATLVFPQLKEDRYAVADRLGLFRSLESPSGISARTIINRIVDNRKAYEARNAKKVKGEEVYYTEAKQYVAEL